LSAEGRARREKLRLQAAQMFSQGIKPVRVARCLRVSAKSAYQWRRCWRAGGEAALASKGAGGAMCRLSERQLARLRAALDAGPVANGWDEDQRWTLARVTALIARLFHVRYTLRGTSYLLHRMGSARRSRRTARRSAIRRRSPRGGRNLGEGSRLAAATGAYVCFEDEAGQGLRPPKARTSARRGHTPRGRRVR
jgi:putative transposase